MHRGYRVVMPWRTRIAAFGSAVALIVAGALCTALIAGGTGQIVGLALAGTGAVLATGLVFFEVGLSEDRERDAMLKRARRQKRPLPLERSRLGQSRGHRRRLS
jgi:hypothetical protein